MIEYLETHAPVPLGYKLERLARSDVPEITMLLRVWYPDIVVGADMCNLRGDFYYKNAFIDDASSSKDIFPIVIRYEREPVALVTFERNVDALTVSAPIGAIAPQHRGSGLAMLGPILLELIGREGGAELAYYFATLKTVHQQVLAERLGYKVVGILPAFDRHMVRHGEVKRVYEAIYAKVLVSSEKILQPSANALTKQTQSLFDFLFLNTDQA